MVRGTLHCHHPEHTIFSFADSALTPLDSKIRDLSIEFSNQVQATWRPQTPMSSPPSVHAASISPFLDTKMSLAGKSLSVSSEGESRALKARKLLPDSHAKSQTDLGNKSDESDESDDELFLDIDMDALRQRGKGNYSCPKGTRCKKGGVDKDGNLVVFDRNSSFAYVTAQTPRS